MIDRHPRVLLAALLLGFGVGPLAAQTELCRFDPDYEIADIDGRIRPR